MKLYLRCLAAYITGWFVCNGLREALSAKEAREQVKREIAKYVAEELKLIFTTEPTSDLHFAARVRRLGDESALSDVVLNRVVPGEEGVYVLRVNLQHVDRARMALGGVSQNDQFEIVVTRV